MYGTYYHQLPISHPWQRSSIPLAMWISVRFCDIVSYYGLPYVIGQTIIFLPCDFCLYSFLLFSSPNLSGRRLDVYHTSTHGVALVRI